MTDFKYYADEVNTQRLLIYIFMLYWRCYQPFIPLLTSRLALTWEDFLKMENKRAKILDGVEELRIKGKPTEIFVIESNSASYRKKVDRTGCYIIVNLNINSDAVNEYLHSVRWKKHDLDKQFINCYQYLCKHKHVVVTYFNFDLLRYRHNWKKYYFRKKISSQCTFIAREVKVENVSVRVAEYFY